MIKSFFFAFTFLTMSQTYSQSTDSLSLDSLLQDKWELFKIIDNMTGSVIPITHKSKTEFAYSISFNNGKVSFNREINRCSNNYKVMGKNEISFQYYDTCTTICCDSDFSEYLKYEDCTKFYIKNVNVLVLISEDYIYYFNRVLASN